MHADRQVAERPNARRAQHGEDGADLTARHLQAADTGQSRLVGEPGRAAQVTEYDVPWAGGPGERPALLERGEAVEADHLRVAAPALPRHPADRRLPACVGVIGVALGAERASDVRGAFPVAVGLQPV